MNSCVMKMHKISLDLQFFCEVGLKLLVEVTYDCLAAGGKDGEEGEGGTGGREREGEGGE